jgi:hypothetical protein
LFKDGVGTRFYGEKYFRIQEKRRGSQEKIGSERKGNTIIDRK